MNQRRAELVELHVDEFSASAVQHRLAVAGHFGRRHLLREQTVRTAGAQHHRPGMHHQPGVGRRIKRQHAGHVPLGIEQQIDQPGWCAHLHAALDRLLVQRRDKGLAGFA